MGNRQQFESVLSQMLYMFNITQIILTWYSIFVKFDYNLFFLISFLYCINLIIFSSNNMNFFFNIILCVVISTFFLFKLNVGAYAGFMFLCESVSLFTLYVLLNKISNDMLTFYLGKNNQKIICTIIYIFIICLFYRLNVNFLPTLIKDNFYQFELTNSNDFWSIYALFYSNYYNAFLIISVFITLVSYLVIVSSNDSIKPKIYKKTINGFLQSCIHKLFSNWNIMSFKKHIVVNYFSK